MSGVKQDKVEYKIGEIVDAVEVPNWTRRPPKWKDLIEAVLNLPVRKSLKVVFPTERMATRARNTIRDTINLRTGKAAIRTRVVAENDEFTVFFTKLADEDIVVQNETRPE